MRIAYAVLVHRNPEQFGRLIDALCYRAKNVEIFVHVDRKSLQEPFCNAVAVASRPLVHFVDRRIKVNWGGYSVVRATLALLREITMKQSRFDYVILLSGQGYPIKSYEFIDNFITRNAGREHIQYSRIPDPEWDINDRYERYHYFDICGNKLGWHLSRIVGRLLPVKRRIPYGIIPHAGSQWWGLTIKCVEYILEYVARYSLYDRFFRYTFVPDEMYFHSIIANSPFSEFVTGESLTHVEWDSEKSRPKIIRLEDLNRLLDSKKLFARKFDIAEDCQVLDALKSAIESA
ncbi:MAG TPA: beta-1,6-N-acetylglucosaminyltransferase [Fimbriiglobus sp.]|jgi:hypothetical protein